MSEHLFPYAKSSANFLRGMESHIEYGSKEWVVGRSMLAASEIDKCISEIISLRARLEKAEAERDQLAEQQIAAVNDLQTARNDALEDAAKRVLEEREFANGPASFIIDGCARAIRALKSQS